jgi:hypothetical protein
MELLARICGVRGDECLALSAISARGHAGGVMKLLVDGEGSFTTRGTIKHGHPAPKIFTSKIVSNAEARM